ncbi:PEGA domain-containing protein [Spirochaeta dissipatitropha]
MKIARVLVLLVSIVSLAFTSCATSTQVRFETDVPGAQLFIDGQNIGTTPTSVKMSNGVWEEPAVLLQKDGYKDLRTGVIKEIKVLNLVSGVVLWWPAYLWVYGPKSEQYYIMIPESNN